MEVSLVDERKSHELVINELVNMIQSGKLKENSKLPSENQMAKKLDISRAHVREVYRAMCIFGICESYRGDGTYFCIDRENSYYLLLPTLYFRFSGNMEAIMEIRKILEVGIAENAAIYRTDADVADMLDCLEKMKKTSDYVMLATYDTQLHSVIGRACGNSMLAELSKIVSGVVTQSIETHWKYIASDSNRILRVKTLDQHKDLVDAIIRKKPYIAKAVAQEHLNMVMRSLDEYDDKDRHSKK